MRREEPRVDLVAGARIDRYETALNAEGFQETRALDLELEGGARLGKLSDGRAQCSFVASGLCLFVGQDLGERHLVRIKRGRIVLALGDGEPADHQR